MNNNRNENLFWSVYKNKFLNLKIWRYINDYYSSVIGINNSLSYNEIKKVEWMVKNKHYSLLYSKVVNGEYLVFNGGISNNNESYSIFNTFQNDQDNECIEFYFKLFTNYPQFKPTTTNSELLKLQELAIKYDNSALIKVLSNEFEIELSSSSTSYFEIIQQCINKGSLKVANYLIDSKKYEINSSNEFEILWNSVFDNLNSYCNGSSFFNLNSNCKELYEKIEFLKKIAPINQLLQMPKITILPKDYILYNGINQEINFEQLIEFSLKIYYLQPILQEFIESFKNIEEFLKFRVKDKLDPLVLSNSLNDFKILSINEIDEIKVKYSSDVLKTKIKHIQDIDSEIMGDVIKLLKMVILFTNTNNLSYLINYIYKSNDFILLNTGSGVTRNEWGEKSSRWSSSRSSEETTRFDHRPWNNSNNSHDIQSIRINDENDYNWGSSQIRFTNLTIYLPRDKDQLNLYLIDNIKSYEDLYIYINFFLQIDNYYFLNKTFQLYLKSRFNQSNPIEISNLIDKVKSEKVIDLIFETFPIKSFFISSSRFPREKTIKDQLEQILLNSINCNFENYIHQHLKSNYKDEYYKITSSINNIIIMNNWSDFENNLEPKILKEMILVRFHIQNWNNINRNYDLFKFFINKIISIIIQDDDYQVFRASGRGDRELQKEFKFTIILLILSSNNQVLIESLFNNKFKIFKPNELILVSYLNSFKSNNHNSKEFIEASSKLTFQSLEFLILKFSTKIVFNSLIEEIVIKSDINLLSYLITRIIKEQEQQHNDNDLEDWITKSLTRSLVEQIFNLNLDNLTILNYLFKNFKWVFEKYQVVVVNQEEIIKLKILLSNINFQFKKPISNDFNGFGNENDQLLNYFYKAIEFGNIEIIDLLIQEFGIDRFKLFYPKLIYPTNLNYFIPNYLKLKYPTINFNEIIKFNEILFK